MEAGAKRHCQRACLVAELFPAGAIVRGVIVRQVGGQVHAVAQIQLVGHASKVPLPQIICLGGVQGGAEGVSELISTAQVGDLVVVDVAAAETVGVVILRGARHITTISHAAGFDQKTFD